MWGSKGPETQRETNAHWHNPTSSSAQAIHAGIKDGAPPIWPESKRDPPDSRGGWSPSGASHLGPDAPLLGCPLPTVSGCAVIAASPMAQLRLSQSLVSESSGSQCPALCAITHVMTDLGRGPLHPPVEYHECIDACWCAPSLNSMVHTGHGTSARQCRLRWESLMAHFCHNIWERGASSSPSRTPRMLGSGDVQLHLPTGQMANLRSRREVVDPRPP